jgi:hypothetical protein
VPVDITGFQIMCNDSLNNKLPTGEFPSEGTVQITATGASTQTAVFSDRVSFVRVHTDTPIRFDIGVNPTASATSPRLAANATEYFGVRSGHRMAVITTT